MRSGLTVIGVHAVLAAWVLLCSPAGAASFNYLYIEASEGNSSGGHTAIQFADDIYHYQHLDSGLIRLFRQEEVQFHFLYRYLQNRPIHRSRIDVSEDTFSVLEDQFKWRFLTQEGHFKLLDDLQKDQTFIRYLLQKLTTGQTLVESDAASVLRLKGVGLFYSESGQSPQPIGGELDRQHSASIQSLRQKVEQRYGPDFLQSKRALIESQIESLAPDRWAVLDSGLTGEKFPAAVYSFEERYSDYLTALFAVKALAEAPPLQSSAFFVMNRDDFKLSEAERPVLLDLREQLETRFVEAIDSSRPDWGYAVLVNMARLVAIEATLQSGYWVFIDDFAQDSEWIAPDQYLEYSSQILVLLEDARTDLGNALKSTTANGHLSEAEYSRLEMAANRHSELLKGERHLAFRFNGQNSLPSVSIAFPEGPIPNLSPEQLTTALAVLVEIESRLFQRLKQDYRYDLITRNCVTELFGTIDQALSRLDSSNDEFAELKTFTINESEKRLGGYVDIPYNFIPFISYQSVLDNYNVMQSRKFNSYRGLELAKLKSRQNSVITELKESNIVSSSLYRYNPDDAFFIFFTEDNWLLRPVFGLMNVAAGIGQSVYGAFSWPLDSGKNLKSGATGLLMSLPELVFFNIRKGSYKYLSFNRMANAGLSGD